MARLRSAAAGTGATPQLADHHDVPYLTMHREGLMRRSARLCDSAALRLPLRRIARRHSCPLAAIWCACLVQPRPAARTRTRFRRIHFDCTPCLASGARSLPSSALSWGLGSVFSVPRLSESAGLRGNRVLDLDRLRPGFQQLSEDLPKNQFRWSKRTAQEAWCSGLQWHALASVTNVRKPRSTTKSTATLDLGSPSLVLTLALE